MNDDSLNTSFWLMVLVQTIGSIDMPGYGSRKMPSPRQYVAIVVAWTVLFIAAGISQGARRAASAFAWLLVLAGMVVGPFGKRVIGLFGSVATNLPSVTPAQSASGAVSQVAAGIGAVSTNLAQQGAP